MTSGVFLGQLISLSVAFTGWSATDLAERGLHTPTLQVAIPYCLLAFTYGSRYFRDPSSPKFNLYFPSSRKPWWVYALLAIVDVEANAAAVRAYQYTSITSIMLLDCLSVPFSMILSYYFLGARYSLRQYVGVLVCMVGLGVLVASDSSPQAPGAAPLIGDALCVVAALFYASSNVGQEAVLKSSSLGGGADDTTKNGVRAEFLALLGIWGFLLSLVQGAFTDLENLKAVHLNTAIIGSLVAFSVSLFFVYVLASRVLLETDSAFFNLSLLSSDLWAMLIAVVFLGTPPPPLYYLAFLLIAAGLTLYHMSPFELSTPTPQNEGVQQVEDTSSSP